MNAERLADAAFGAIVVSAATLAERAADVGRATGRVAVVPVRVAGRAVSGVVAAVDAVAPELSTGARRSAAQLESVGRRRRLTARAEAERVVRDVVGAVAAYVVEQVDLDAAAARLDVDAVVARADLDAAVSRVDIDAILDRVDLDAVAARLDVDAVVARADLDAAVTRVDIDAILDRVDLDAVAARLDVDAVVARADLDRAAARVDVEKFLDRVDLIGIAQEVVDGIGLPDIVRESTGSLASETMGEVRVQGMAADDAVSRVVDRFRLRKPARLPAPPQP